jgi:hypothetical protein
MRQGPGTVQVGAPVNLVKDNANTLRRPCAILKQRLLCVTRVMRLFLHHCRLLMVH